MAMPRDGRRLTWMLPVLPALGLAACTYPTVPLHVRPDPLTVVQGGSATVTVRTDPPRCVPHEDDPEPIACQDIAGRVFDYVLQDVPPGVSYLVDTSLLSPATPGVARITFDVDADATPGEHFRVVVHAVLAGRSVGHESLDLRILPAGPTPAATGAVSIAANASYSVAALADGSVRAWGENGDGQLGTGDRVRRRAPTLVETLDGIVAVAAGPAHALALAAGGRLWAWGVNANGQLGNGERTALFDAETSPVAVQGVHNVQAIAAGEEHSLALKSDGTVWAWGDGLYGKLGNGDTEDRLLPTQVIGLPRAQAIAAGRDYSLAVAVDGSVWIWGGTSLDMPGTVARTPVQVPGLSRIRAIATHTDAVLAVDQDGGVWAWGSNQSGRLGDGTETDRVMPVRIEGLPEIAAVALGVHRGLALAVDGTLWDWGRTHLGDGGFGRLVPGIVPSLDGVQAIAAGDHHALAMLECGQIWGWGENGYGQLGEGANASPRTPPVPAEGIGDGDCGQVVLRVSLAGPRGNVEDAVTADAGALEWNGADWTGVFDRGTPVRLTAQAEFTTFLDDETFTFDGWAGDCQGPDPQVLVTLDRDQRCVAKYRQTSAAPRLLSVFGGAGGVVTSSGGGILGPEAIDCGPACQAIFREGTTVDLTATAAAGFGFDRWSLDCAGTTPQLSVVISGPTRCRAEFRPYALSVAVSGGGRVTSDPAGLDCGATCAFAPGVGEVALTALPDVGYEFEAWGGDCAGTDARAVVAMDGDRTCSATFRRIPGLFLLTTGVEGEGSLTSVPAGISCPGACVAAYAAGTAVDLAAHETPRSRVAFWFDDCAAPGTPANQVVMDADKRCRVQFVGQPAQPVAAFAYAPVPHVGRLVTFDGTASHVFDPVTGTQDPRLVSFSWDFDGDGAFDASGNRSNAAIAQYAFQTAGDHAALLRVVGGPFESEDVHVETVTVRDAALPLFGLVVEKAGTGEGTVATDPPGLIRCAPGCVAAGPILLETGTPVTLTATPREGSTFSGWTGAGCTATGPEVQVTMSEARTCTATFTAAPPAGPFTLTVVVNATGPFASVVGVQPAGNVVNCFASGGPACTQSFAADTVVVVRPSGTAIEFGLFPTWTGCDGVAGLFECTVTLTGDRTVTASFGP